MLRAQRLPAGSDLWADYKLWLDGNGWVKRSASEPAARSLFIDRRAQF
jgi:hypothetical protein